MSEEVPTEFAEAKTVVLWDVEDYKIPNGLSPLLISENIKAGLASMGYHGPVTFKAYCNETNPLQKEEDGFLAAGMKLKHVPEGRKGKDHSRDMRIYSDMWLWTMDNRDEPSNLMVISDNLFVSTVIDFKAMNCNVLWKRLSAEGMPIAHQSGRSSQRIDNACSSCGIKIQHDH